MNSEIPKKDSVRNPPSWAEADDRLTYLIAALPGISLAGLFYAVICIVILFSTLAWSDTPRTVSDFFQMMLIFLGYLFSGCIVGALIAVIAGTIAILLVHFFNRSLGSFLGPRATVFCAGSLAGFASTAWIALGPIEFTSEQVLVVFLGPIFAMLIGAFVTNWYAAKYVEPKMPFVDELQLQQKPFRIFHLMMLTAWVAAILGISSGVGVPRFAILVGFWLVVNSMLLAMFVGWRKRRLRKTQ